MREKKWTNFYKNITFLQNYTKFLIKKKVERERSKKEREKSLITVADLISILH